MALKKQPIEYRLLVHHDYDETLKRPGIRFVMETSKLFTNFSYLIDVKDEAEGSSLLWTLHGLRAPSMNMPSTGAAQFQKMYFDLPRTVRFTLVKKDTVKAETTLTFLKNGIDTERTRSSFLKIYTDPQEFESQRLNDRTAAEPKPDQSRKPAPVKKSSSGKKR